MPVRDRNRSPSGRFTQQNLAAANSLLRIAEYPTAIKVFLLISQKANNKNALVASNKFFIKSLGISRASADRAINLLKSENIVQVKRFGGASIYVLNPDLIWDNEYCELEGNIILTKDEWSDSDE